MAQERMVLFTWLDYILLAVTVFISLGVGLYQALAGGRQNTTDEYLMGNRSLRVFPAAVSLVVSFLSAVSIIGFPAEMYYFGLTFWMFILGGCFGLVAAAFCYIPVFYPLKMTSVNEYLQLRYGSRFVVLLGFATQVFVQVLYAGFVMFGPAIMVNLMTGFPIWATMLFMGLIGTAYTALGGLKAVVWTDFFQAIVILGGFLTTILKGTILTGGPGEVWHQYSKGGRAFLDISPSPFRRQTVWGMFTHGFLQTFLMFSGSQVGVQRYSSVPSMQAAKRVMLLAIVPMVVLQTLSCLNGIVAFAYFAKQGCEPLTAGYIKTPNEIMPYFVMHVLNYPGVPGVFCACVLCGSLSNLSSSLNSIAALTWIDLLSHKSTFSHLTEERKTAVTKFISCVFGICGLGCAFVIGNFKGTLMQATVLLVSVCVAPALVLFSVGPAIPRVNWKSVLVGVLAATAVSVFLGLGTVTAESHLDVLPGDVSGCSSFNNTSGNDTLVDTFHSVGRWQMNTVEFPGSGVTTESSPPSSSNEIKGWRKVFQISQYWLLSISCITGLLISFLASFLPGFSNGATERPPSTLYFPCIKAALDKKKCKKEYEAVHMQESDVNGISLKTADDF